MDNDYTKLMIDLNGLLLSIENTSIQAFTIRMVKGASTIWLAPASRSHHLPDERIDCGNLLHTVRVASMCKFIADTVTLEEPSPGPWRDILLSAAILHDTRRRGLFSLASHTVDDHPKLVREYANIHHLTCSYFEEIMTTIEDHMGKWSVPPVILKIDAHTALHLADCIVAGWAEIMPSGSKEKEGTND